MGSERKLAGRTRANAFFRVNGLRTTLTSSTLYALTSGQPEEAPFGRVALVAGRIPVRSSWER